MQLVLKILSKENERLLGLPRIRRTPDVRCSESKDCRFEKWYCVV